VSKKDWPSAEEMKNYCRLMDDHELIRIYNGSMDVYPRNSGVQWRLNSYQDGDAHILRIPKNKISEFEVSLRAGVVTVQWHLNGTTYHRRFALGSQHDPSSLKAVWVRSPVKWSDCFTELWIVLKWYSSDKQIIAVTEQPPREYNPEIALIAFSPGEIIRDYMDSLELSQEEVARLANITPETLQGILDEAVTVTEPIAIGLQNALQRPAHFWLNLQTNFDKANSEIQ